MRRLALVAALAAALNGCLALGPQVQEDAELAPGDLRAPDLTRLACVRRVSGDPIVLVRGDVAELPVVVRTGGANERAAKFLADMICEMTGVRPAVIVERANGPAVTNAPALYVGDTAAAVKRGLLPFRHVSGRFDGVGSERFRVVSRDGSFYFIGRADHAVYDWCERQLGIRFYWPERLSDVYGGGGTNRIYGLCAPTTRGLSVRPADYEDQPVFECRDNWPYEGTGWNVCAKGGDSHRGGVTVHAPHKWFADTNLVARLPEIFALTEDGRRAVSPLLCYGNPKTLEYYKGRIIDEIENGVSAGGIVNCAEKVVTVSQWDCDVRCFCEHCSRLYDSSLGASGAASPIIWGCFTAELAKWMKERYPDWMIAILPYMNTCDPPPGLDLTRLGNVEAMLCTMPGLAMLKNRSCREHEESLVRRWAEVTGRPVLNWHYSCWPAEFTSAPYVYGETIRRHYAAMRDTVVGSFINGGYDLPRFSLSVYVWMRCLWNPDIDVGAIYDGFARRMFGKAAKPMRRLIDLQERGWNRQWTSDACSPKNIHLVSYPRRDVLRMKSLLNEAEIAAADDERALARVRWYASGFADFFAESDEVATGEPFPAFRIARTEVDPVIDGRLDESCWRAAESRNFVAAVCRTNSTPWLRTEVRAVWTEKGVTFGFRCEEPAVEKMDFSKPKGDPWGQDTLEIFLDCSEGGDGHWNHLLFDCRGRLSAFADGREWRPHGVRIGISPNAGEWSAEAFVPYEDLTGVPDMRSPNAGMGACRWRGNMVRWRVGDMSRPAAERVAGSRYDWSRLNTRYNRWNKDLFAFSEWVFDEVRRKN